ncbi:MAG: Hpt domain-containing protein [Spirochaetales bacterium]|nr:Hpt domain-containing protein [Spirochaetales bacterium]
MEKKLLPINMTEFKEIADGDLALAENLVTSFLTTYPEQLMQIDSSVSGEKGTELYQATHKLANALKVLGAEKAVKISTELELKCKKEELDGTADLAGQLKTQVLVLSDFFKKPDWKKWFNEA